MTNYHSTAESVTARLKEEQKATTQMQLSKKLQTLKDQLAKEEIDAIQFNFLISKKYDANPVIEVNKQLNDYLKQLTDAANKHPKQTSKKLARLEIVLSHYYELKMEILSFQTLLNASAKEQHEQASVTSKSDHAARILTKTAALSSAILTLPQKVVSGFVAFLGATIGFVVGATLGAFYGIGITIAPLAALDLALPGIAFPGIAAAAGVGSFIGSMVGAKTGFEATYQPLKYGLFANTISKLKHFEGATNEFVKSHEDKKPNLIKRMLKLS